MVMSLHSNRTSTKTRPIYIKWLLELFFKAKNVSSLKKNVLAALKFLRQERGLNV